MCKAFHTLSLTHTPLAQTLEIAHPARDKRIALSSRRRFIWAQAHRTCTFTYQPTKTCHRSHPKPPTRTTTTTSRLVANAGSQIRVCQRQRARPNKDDVTIYREQCRLSTIRIRGEYFIRRWRSRIVVVKMAFRFGTGAEKKVVVSSLAIMPHIITVWASLMGARDLSSTIPARGYMD